MFKNHPNVFAIGVNCTVPQYISSIIANLKKVIPNKKIIVYPNSGEAYNITHQNWIGIADPMNFNEMVQEWVEIGADIVGGCCRITPNHIKKIAEIL